MSRRISDKLLLIVIITVVIVLTAGEVTAVHVSVVLTVVIFGALDELEKRAATPYILAAAAAVGTILIPSAGMLIPMSVYALMYRRSAPGYVTAGLVTVTLFANEESALFTGLCLIVNAFAAYLGWMTSYYDRMLLRSNVLFDEARQRAQDSVRQRRAMREKADTEIYMTRLRERNRIAREIHDNVGHMITRAIVQMQAIRIINRDPALGKQLESVSETLDLSMTGIRKSVHELHDDSIDLAVSINDIAKTLPERFKCEISTSIESPADNETKTALLGIVKEAVTNISKHSSGSNVHIDLVENVSFWRLLVQDDGRCPEREYTRNECMTSDGSGIGLGNIFERAHGCDGRVSIRSGEKGFVVLATIPKHEQKAPLPAVR